MKKLQTGIDALAEMFNVMEPELRKKILTNVAKVDPRISKKIEEAMFTFDDLRKLDRAGIQKLLKDIPQKQWAVALRKTSEDVRAFVFSQMPSRAAALLRDEIEARGPQLLSEVRKAQAAIVEKAKKLLG